MIWIFIALLFVLLLAVILFDAAREELKRSAANFLRTCKPVLAAGARLTIKFISWLQRLLWWLRTHVGLLIAIAAGASITATGYLVEIHYEPTTKWLGDLGGAELLKGIENWAPHFGPELIVLAFAAIFVEGALRKREQLRERRFRTVQSFMYLVNYALQRQLYFDGGSSKFLEMEKDALTQRSESRRRTLWFDERRSYEAAEKTALEFIEETLKFAQTVDRLKRERARLRADQLLLGHPWSRIVALENMAEAAFRKVPLSTAPNDLTIDDLLDEDARQDWEDDRAYLLDRETYLEQNLHVRKPLNADYVVERLDKYLVDYSAAIQFRVELLKRFAAFQAAVLSLRNRVWASDNPDE
jgi:hypothetical protein